MVSLEVTLVVSWPTQDPPAIHVDCGQLPVSNNRLSPTASVKTVTMDGPAMAGSVSRFQIQSFVWLQTLPNQINFLQHWCGAHLI